MQMQFGSRVLELSSPVVMGILNVTPDSFFDGGRHYRGGRPDLSLVLDRARAMVEEGAEIIDIGGESTRPGASAVSVDEECERVLPVVERLARELDVVLSVDTSTPEVMQGAAACGAGLINDVRALSRPGALEVAAESGLAVCLMHMQGMPATMQADPRYGDAVAEVWRYLAERKAACQSAGIAPERILVDPGIGFGKRVEHNLALIRELERFTDLAPVLLGVSRKSMFAKLLHRDLGDRLAGSLATAVLAMARGASILRVHDVAATRDAVTMFKLIGQA